LIKGKRREERGEKKRKSTRAKVVKPKAVNRMK
jgi:hypothetical protein